MNLIRWTLAIALATTFAVAGCAPQAAEEEPPVAEEPAPAPEGTPAGEATITVDGPVALEDQSVTIRSVEATGPAWLVIHADENDTPGPDLGATQVQAGTNENVRVELESAPEGEKVWAMLHVDVGQAGQYEFPDSDPPVMIDGQILVVPVELQR